MHMSVAQAYAILEHSSVVELPAYIRRVPGSIPGVPILGKRQRLVVWKGLFMGRLQKISDEDFTKAVKESKCVQEVLDKLGYGRSSGSMGKFISKRIEALNIDTSHFDVAHKRSSHPVYSLQEILVENSCYGNIDRLKKRILKANLLEYKCEKCGNIGEWQGEKLSLQLEHKNGIHNDHRLNNLCFLCPNCHSQTDTYAGKNRERHIASMQLR